MWFPVLHPERTRESLIEQPNGDPGFFFRTMPVTHDVNTLSCFRLLDTTDTSDDLSRLDAQISPEETRESLILQLKRTGKHSKIALVGVKSSWFEFFARILLHFDRNTATTM